MTLSLDEVRNIRFPMVRKPNEDGYRASSVDNFMDKLEISYAQLVEEIDTLRAAKEASVSAQGNAAELESVKSDLERTRAELDQLRSQNAAEQSGSQHLRDENERLNGEVSALRSQLDELRASSDTSATAHQQLRNDNEQLLQQVEQLREALAQAEQRAVQAESVAANARHYPTAAETTQTMGVITDDGVQHLTVTTSSEASSAVVRLVELATQQAETLLADAKSEAQRHLDQTNAEAARLAQEAQDRADQLDSESRQNAERILSDARTRADRLDSEIRDRRAELFTSLENDRDLLLDRVNQLREYEENYRRTFTGFLQTQIEHLNSADVTPGAKPNSDAMYGLGQTEVSTPRLDALMNEAKEQFNN